MDAEADDPDDREHERRQVVELEPEAKPRTARAEPLREVVEARPQNAREKAPTATQRPQPSRTTAAAAALPAQEETR